MSDSIPACKEGATESKYHLSVGKKKVILTIHESIDSFMIYAGGLRTYCIQLQIMKPESSYARIADVRIGNLSKLAYHIDCTDQRDFQRGIDTTNLVKCILSYVHDTYPYVSHLSFTDMSTRPCDSGAVVSLPELSYLTTGKTWYEMHFSAFLEPPYADLFNQEHAKFQSLKQYIPWGTLERDFFGKMPPGTEDLYAASPTWQAFFHEIRNRMGVSDFCSFASPWLTPFMRQFMKFSFSNAHYSMPVRGGFPYEIRPYISGGRRKRYTQKAYAYRSSRDER
jgi:hypothetical protein